MTFVYLLLLVSLASCQLKVLITEIMYNPREYQSFEYIEFYNNASTPLSTAGWKITGSIQYTFGTTNIPVGGYIVVAHDPAKIMAQYKITGVLGPYTGSLDDGGKEVFLSDASGPLVSESYKVTWNELANGLGSSLELICYNYNPANGSKKHHWVGSVAQAKADPHEEYSGSPGSSGRWRSCTEKALKTKDVFFSEIMYHSYYTLQYEDEGEFVELKNNGTEPVDISNYRIIVQDGFRYSFPDKTPVVPPGGFVIVATNPNFFKLEYPANTAPVYGPAGPGGLPGKVTTITLIDTNGQVVDLLDYDNKDPFPYACDSLGAPNSSLRTDSPFMEWVPQSGHPFGGWFQIKPRYQGNGQSLTRRSWQWDTDHGYNWKAADPSPGRDNLDTLLLPIVSSTYVTPQTGTKYYNITPNTPVTVTFEIRPFSKPGNLAESGYAFSTCQIIWFLDDVAKGTKSATTTSNCLFDGNTGFNFTIPGRPGNSIVRYTVRLVLTGSLVGTITAPTVYYPFRYFGYFVEPTGGYSPDFDTYHMFIKQRDWYRMIEYIEPGRASVDKCPYNVLWNQGVNCTLIYKGEIFDSEVRIQGSRWQRTSGDAVDLAKWNGLGPVNDNGDSQPLKIYSYRVNLPGDRDINGNNAIILYKAKQGCTFYQTPLINRLGRDMGIATATTQYGRVRFNGKFLRFMMVIQHGGSEWIKAAYKEIEHKCLHQSKELIFGDVFKAHGSPQEGPYVEGNFQYIEDNRIPQCPQYKAVDIYEATYGRMSFKRMDHTPLIDLTRGLSTLSRAQMPQFLAQNFDMNQMLSYHAWMYVWAKSWDQKVHNVVVVRRNSDKKWSWLPWDADSMFGEFFGWDNADGLNPEVNLCGQRWYEAYNPQIEEVLQILSGSILTPTNMGRMLDEIKLEFPQSEYSASNAWAPYEQDIPKCETNLRKAFTDRHSWIRGQLGAPSGNATTRQAARFCPDKPTITILKNFFKSVPGPTQAPELSNSLNASNVNVWVPVGNPNHDSQSFTIQRSIDGTSWTQIATGVMQTSDFYVNYTDLGVPVGNNISYRIISKNALGDSLPSPMSTISVSRNCVWNPWSSFPPCPVTCAGSNVSQTRTNTGPPANGGLPCSGPDSNWTICNPQACPINCVWGNWSAFGPCSKPCAGGNQTQTRTFAVLAQYGGLNCTGPSSNTTSCNNQPCPVDCIWGNWSLFGPCSVTCGGGNQTQTRTNSGIAQFGGKNCTGPFENTTVCGTNPCPINCTWGNWSAFGTCSVLCGGGNQTQTRKEIPAQYGGANCTGPSSNTTSCNPQDCPVDCVWGNWSEWTTCSLTCGGGNQTQTRINSGNPQFGGQNCTGPFENTTECNIQSCPIDCVGNWSSWAACDCETKTQLRSFGITVPAQFGGIDCNWTGTDTETQDCVPVSCGPEDCVGSWSNWSSCDCTTYKHTQSFVVSTPESNGGKACEEVNGASKEESCYPRGCPVDCVGEWGPWPACDCSTNTTTATFSVFVQPLNGGLECLTAHGNNDTKDCVVDEPETDCLPVNCVGAWEAWSECNCASNSSYRVFNISVLESNGGEACVPAREESESQKCECDLGNGSGSPPLAPWVIALIALGVLAFIALLAGLGVALFTISASSSFEVV